MEDLLIVIASIPAWLLVLTNLAAFGGMVVVWHVQKRAAAAQLARSQAEHELEIKQMLRERSKEIDKRKRLYDDKRRDFEKYRLTLDEHRKKQRMGAFTRSSVDDFLAVLREMTRPSAEMETLSKKYHGVVDAISRCREANAGHFEQLQKDTEGLMLVSGTRLHPLLSELTRHLKKDFDMAESLLESLTHPDVEFFDPAFPEEIRSKQQQLDERADELATLYQSIMAEMREELNAV